MRRDAAVGVNIEEEGSKLELVKGSGSENELETIVGAATANPTILRIREAFMVYRIV